MIYFLVVQLLAVFVALVDIFAKRDILAMWQDSSQGHFLSIVEHLGLLVVHLTLFICARLHSHHNHMQYLHVCSKKIPSKGI